MCYFRLSKISPSKKLLLRSYVGVCNVALLLIVASPFVLDLFDTASPFYQAKAEEAEDEPVSAKKPTKNKVKKESVEPDLLVGDGKELNNRILDQLVLERSSADIVFLLDSSRSMLRSDPFRVRDQGIKLLLKLLKSTDRVSVIEFDTNARPLMDLTPLLAENVPSIDGVIDNVNVSGGWTDLYSPVDIGFQLLKQKGRKDVVKALILLSDGKMEPPPERGASKDFTNKLLEELVPLVRRSGIKIYTIALSDNADRDLLAAIAQRTDGIERFSKDAEDMHRIFFEIFLSLKAPQLLTVEKEEISVDEKVKDITFYVERASPKENLSLIDPRGKSYSIESGSGNIHWYRGDRFDLISVADSNPGVWQFRDATIKQGVAVVSSDMKLDVHWAKNNLAVGDRIAVTARLMDKDKISRKKDIQQGATFNFEITADDTKELIDSGKLLDEGESGDVRGGDNLRATVIRMEQPGHYTGRFILKTPELVREQRLPFSVAESSVKLKLIKANPEINTPDIFRVSLSRELRRLYGLKVELIVSSVSERQTQKLSVRSVKDERGVYEVEATDIADGRYQVYARVFERKGKRIIQHTSKSLVYVAKSKQRPEKITQPETAKAEELLLVLKVGSSFSLLALILVGALGAYLMIKIKRHATTLTPRERYLVPLEIEKQIEEIKRRVSEERREVTEKDKELFALVPQVFGLAAKEESLPAEGAKATQAENGAGEQSTEVAKSAEEGSESNVEKTTENEARDSSHGEEGKEVSSVATETGENKTATDAASRGEETEKKSTEAKAE